jgi:hypothetical protein
MGGEGSRRAIRLGGVGQALPLSRNPRAIIEWGL